jgi:hypothetical protein
MDAEHTGGFWGRTPPSARSALLAALVELLLGLLVFVLLAALASVSTGVSPWSIIFGPVPGRPLITWLYFLAPVVALQGAVGLALRHPARLLRAAGTLGACGIAAFALFWVAAALYGFVAALFGGWERYVEVGGLATVPFVPIALLLAGLNARAGLLGLRGVRPRGGVLAVPG